MFTNQHDHNLRSQWRMYPTLNSHESGTTLGQPSKIKSFFCSTKTRSFTLLPFRLAYHEQKGCMDADRPSHLLPSLLLSSEEDYFVDNEGELIFCCNYDFLKSYNAISILIAKLTF